jgi:hypothetical protein
VKAAAERVIGNISPKMLHLLAKDYKKTPESFKKVES